jgi:excisionase family DNA binding protein
MEHSEASASQPRHVSPLQLAEQTGIHVSTIYRFIRRGAFNVQRAGRLLRIDADEATSVLQAAGYPHRINAYVDRVVAEAPPLTADQLVRVATVLDESSIPSRYNVKPYTR